MVLTNPIAAGNTADIYLHEGKLVKLFKDCRPNTEAEYEANKQRYAHAKGLPVPSIFEVTNINGRHAIIMEHILGDTIGNMMFGNMAMAEHYMSITVDMQLKIHAIKASDFELMENKLQRQLLSVPVLSEKQKDALVDKLYCMQHDKTLCHGDYHVYNLISNKIGTTIIDWVDSSAGDAKSDACRSYLLYSQYSIELADLYLRLYAEKSGVSQEDILVWIPIIAGARLSENVSSENANRLIEIVNQFLYTKETSKWKNY